MKRFFILILISLFTAVNAQEVKNRFEENGQSVYEGTVDHTNDYQNDAPESGPGGPGEPVPVDNYIPLFLTAAVGIIIYTTHKKRKLLTQK